MAIKELEVNLWSDIDCYWYYIGETILKREIQEFNKKHTDIKVKLIFYSFFIKAQENECGEDFQEFNKCKCGSDGWNKELVDKGRKYGCQYANWKFWPNITFCHKLISEAKKTGKCIQDADTLFLALYEQEKNVSF